jgi:hypothetical protein
MNEREFPHVVELEPPSAGFRSHSFEFSTVTAASRSDVAGDATKGQFHISFYFPDAAPSGRDHTGPKPLNRI